MSDKRRRRRSGSGESTEEGRIGPLKSAAGRSKVSAFTDPSTAPEDESLRLSELLREDLVKIYLSDGDQWRAVRELLDMLVGAGELPEDLAKTAFLAVMEREAIRPTGFKYELAFPNGRVRGLRRIIAAVGIAPSGLDFGCRDGLPAKIIILLLFPESRYARFAHAINDIAETLEDPGLRAAILSAEQGMDVVLAIEDAETRDFS